jgi:hypothetical protein
MLDTTPHGTPAVMKGSRVLLPTSSFLVPVQLAEIKAARGLSADDGTIAADKPLAEVLRERKDAKQAEFEDKWRQMKQGESDDKDVNDVNGLASATAKSSTDPLHLSMLLLIMSSQTFRPGTWYIH